ncbi:hypothetical protein [Paraherbaspirillum soli]|uniref:Uncharacterized protein n=1 Tax=Paraherbaspirillum soli TaxID=631222 RepID=A0ABW0M6P5_9BURK
MNSDYEEQDSMYFKPLLDTFINGTVCAGMIFARALSLLLPLPIGCLASR